ncbi:MAG TPA: hypothetical protein VEY12_09890 [Thermoplasmata archaeon]|nr:hypothetical protein [Thermoplasmata archaeon]
MDLVWLVIPAAVGLFVLRTFWIARKLKHAAKSASAADGLALRAAQRALGVHREHLHDAVARPKEHLAAAKALSRVPTVRARSPSTGLDAMVEDFLPERRL